MEEKLVRVIPVDGDVPHPYDSNKKIKKGGEDMRLCGQVRRLIRRNQVKLDLKDPSDNKESDTSEGDKPTKSKSTKRKGKGHQSKPSTTES